MSVWFNCKIFVVLFECLCLVLSRRVKRVINGQEVLCGTQPRIGSLRNASISQHLCGVTLLSSRFALTAAHCVEYAPDEYIIYLNNYCKIKEYPKVTILEIIIHNLYDRKTQAHDIALLRINLAIIDDLIWIINDILPTSYFGLSGTNDCVIYGYGYRDRNVKDISENLMYGAMKIISLDDCTEALGLYLAPNPESGMLCALGDGVDSCQGDSGGPLICNGLIEGISSYGMSCGVPGLPGVYTSIRTHLNWIRENIE